MEMLRMERYAIKYHSGERYGFAMSNCSNSDHRCYVHGNEVVNAGNNIDIVAHHGGYVDYADRRNETGVRLLEHRESNLVRYIRESPDLALGNVEECLVGAFTRLDKELEAMVKQNECPPFTSSAEELWRTRYNSLVIVVDRNHGRVHVAGSGQVHAVLLSSSTNNCLTSRIHSARAEYNRQTHYRPFEEISYDVNVRSNLRNFNAEHKEFRSPRLIDTHKQLFFYKQAELLSEHEHLVLASEEFVEEDTWFRTPCGLYADVPLVHVPDYFVTMGFESLICQIVEHCPQMGRAEVLLFLCLDHHKHSGLKRSGYAAVDTSSKDLKLSEDCEGAQPWLCSPEAAAPLLISTQ